MGMAKYDKFQMIKVTLKIGFTISTDRKLTLVRKERKIYSTAKTNEVNLIQMQKTKSIHIKL